MHCPRHHRHLAEALQVACFTYLQPAFENELLKWAALLDPRVAYLSKVLTASNWDDAEDSLIQRSRKLSKSGKSAKYGLCLVERSEMPRVDVVNESIAKRSKRSTWDAMYDDNDCTDEGDLQADDVLKVPIVILVNGLFSGIRQLNYYYCSWSSLDIVLF